jgi:hypothetical protein
VATFAVGVLVVVKTPDVPSVTTRVTTMPDIGLLEASLTRAFTFTDPPDAMDVIDGVVVPTAEKVAVIFEGIPAPPPTVTAAPALLLSMLDGEQPAVRPIRTNSPLSTTI